MSDGARNSAVVDILYNLPHNFLCCMCTHLRSPLFDPTPNYLVSVPYPYAPYGKTTKKKECGKTLFALRPSRLIETSLRNEFVNGYMDAHAESIYKFSEYSKYMEKRIKKSKRSTKSLLANHHSMKLEDDDIIRLIEIILEKYETPYKDEVYYLEKNESGDYPKLNIITSNSIFVYINDLNYDIINHYGLLLGNDFDEKFDRVLVKIFPNLMRLRITYAFFFRDILVVKLGNGELVVKLKLHDIRELSFYINELFPELDVSFLDRPSSHYIFAINSCEDNHISNNLDILMKTVLDWNYNFMIRNDKKNLADKKYVYKSFADIVKMKTDRFRGGDDDSD